MFHLEICVVAVILTSTSALDLCSDKHEGPCKKSSSCEPLVTPMNSTHLRVNWENVFEEGCEDSHIETMEIETKENRTTAKRKTVTLSQKETFVKVSPCQQHIITVKMIMTDTYGHAQGRSFLTTPAVEYNKIEQKSEKYPFDDLLGSKVVPKICLKAKQGCCKLLLNC